MNKIKIILILFLVVAPAIFYGQFSDQLRAAFIYSPGISWTENKTQDSVVTIFIEGDTMKAIRNLLEYCLQEEEEKNFGALLLDNINLDTVARKKNNYYFYWFLRDYRKSVAKHRLKRKSLKP